MDEIKMTFQGKTYTFQIGYKCDAYCFLECREKPENRGFFTNNYIQANLV